MTRAGGGTGAYGPFARPGLLLLGIAGMAGIDVHLLDACERAGIALPRFRPAVVAPVPTSPIAHPISDVWRVEQSATSEVYSNGLRVDNSFAVSHHPRKYVAFPTLGGGEPAARKDPVGIVFHSTESRQAPFEAGHNEALKRIGELLLDYIRRRHSYHFVIDRFGRVFRVVAESDSANHAGHSVWADERWQYANLNQSFLGVAFESETRRAAGDPEITAAQTRSAVMLVEMLRARYQIQAGNCVTHAQVSVNPANMRVGYHVDWASEFPFEALGLTNNYTLALPSIWAFGFESRQRVPRRGAWANCGLGERGRKPSGSASRGNGPRVPAYRKRLQQQYRQKLAVVRRLGPAGDADR